MKVIYSFLHVVEADGSIQLRTDTQVYLDCDDESKPDIISSTYDRNFILRITKVLLLDYYARFKVRVFHSWARVRRNGPSAQFVRRSVGSLRRIGTWAPA